MEEGKEGRKGYREEEDESEGQERQRSEGKGEEARGWDMD